VSSDPDGRVTLADHIRATAGPSAGDLGDVVGALAEAGVAIARALARAALTGQQGATGAVNVQGEAVATLDVWANEAVVQALAATGLVCTMVSEEMAEVLHLPERCGRAPFTVCFDPVDGSSNLDVGGVVGTIFSIRGAGRGPAHDKTDAVRPGTAQRAAGYILYGPATTLVLTTGQGVAAFTLDADRGAWVRTQAAIRIPARGRIYSVNEGNTARWAPEVQHLVAHYRTAERPYSARYVGALVADVHRTLLKGGIFLYPADAAAGGQPAGKLRLQYEAAPMAFLVEQAGGAASTGRERIMTVVPSGPHQRVPLLIGSPDDVRLAEEYVTGRR
jgi:fructose-1,6-bisphosphatase I